MSRSPSFLNHTAQCPPFTGPGLSAFLPTETPFYYSPRPSLISGISDRALALTAPIVAFWALSLTFHLLDVSDWKWLHKYRIHESAEVRSRNRASRSEVVRAVLLQQLIQTVLGFLWMSSDASSKEYDHKDKMEDIARVFVAAVGWVFGERTAEQMLMLHGPTSIYFIYWWGIPAVQFLLAMCAFRHSLAALICVHAKRPLGSSSIHGSTFFTALCTPTNFCTNTFIQSTIVSMCPMRSVRSTITQSRVSSSIPWAPS
jgi:hypothetical protein